MNDNNSLAHTTWNCKYHTKLIIFMCATVLLQACLTIYRNRILVKFQKKMVLLSARDFINNLFRLPIGFFDQRYVGDLVGRVGNNANVSDFLAGELAETVLNLFVVAFFLVLLIIYSPILTVIALASVLINLIVVKISSSVMVVFTDNHE